MSLTKTKRSVQDEMTEVLEKLGIRELNHAWSTGQNWASTAHAAEKEIYSPVDGQLLASVRLASEVDYEEVMAMAQKAFLEWRQVPAPKRGEVVRQIGDKLRAFKAPLGRLVS